MWSKKKKQRKRLDICAHWKLHKRKACNDQNWWKRASNNIIYKCKYYEREISRHNKQGLAEERDMTFSTLEAPPNVQIKLGGQQERPGLTSLYIQDFQQLRKKEGLCDQVYVTLIFVIIVCVTKFFVNSFESFVLLVFILSSFHLIFWNCCNSSEWSLRERKILWGTQVRKTPLRDVS